MAATPASTPSAGGSSSRNADALALFTVDEAAEVLALSGEGVRGLVRAGKLRAYRLGDGPKARIRIPSGAIAEFLRESRTATVETR